MSGNYKPEISIDEWEEIMFSADVPNENKASLLIDWDLFGDNERRCKGCDKFKKEKGYGDFICKHVCVCVCVNFI